MSQLHQLQQLQSCKIFITTFRVISWPIQKFITSALPATEALNKVGVESRFREYGLDLLWSQNQLTVIPGFTPATDEPKPSPFFFGDPEYPDENSG